MSEPDIQRYENVRPDVELWECITPGTVIVLVWDVARRDYRSSRVNGTRGPKRLRITREDREYNQSLVSEDRRQSDPFTNGRLARVVDGTPVGATTEGDLRALLALRGDAFEQVLATHAHDELLLRRLRIVAKAEGTMAQNEAISAALAPYRKGGTQRTVAEMIDAGEKLGVSYLG